MPPRFALARLVVDVGRLGRLLGPFPGGPRLALDPIELLEFDLPGEVEIPDHRLPPLLADPLQVGTHRGLRVAQVLGDLGLGPALDVEVGHLLAAFDDGQFFAACDRHY